MTCRRRIWGGPARGAGWGGPAKGAGWGGPAKGDGDATRFTLETRPGSAVTMAGRIKAEALRLLLAGDIPAVAETWRSIMNDPTANPAARIQAAEKIAERVEGKVSQPIEHRTLSAESMSDDDLARIAAGGSGGADPAQDDPPVSH